MMSLTFPLKSANLLQRGITPIQPSQQKPTVHEENVVVQFCLQSANIPLILPSNVIIDLHVLLRLLLVLFLHRDILIAAGSSSGAALVLLTRSIRSLCRSIRSRRACTSRWTTPIRNPAQLELAVHTRYLFVVHAVEELLRRLPVPERDLRSGLCLVNIRELANTL